METATIVQLQADIAHLTHLLEVVVLENAETKGDIAYLKKIVGNSERIIVRSKTEVGNTVPLAALPENYYRAIGH